MEIKKKKKLKKFENCKRAKKKKTNKQTNKKQKTKSCVMKLSQIPRRIELCMREIILRFAMNS
jgi:hypothetical protein